MKIGVIGEGPAASVIESQCGESSATVSRIDTSEVEAQDMIVLTGAAGDERFHTVNDRVQSTAATLVTVELGGIGGHRVADVEGAVSRFDQGGPCFTCLETRIAAVDPEISEDDGADGTLARFAGAVAGREAVRRLGRDPEPTGWILELPVTRRTLLPVPGCATCGIGETRWAIPANEDDGSRDLAGAVSAAENVFDERLGPVITVGEVTSVPLPYYLAQLAETAGFSDQSAAPHAAGVAEDWDAAFMKAVGECLERYAAGVYRTGELREDRPESLAGAISPDAFVRPSSWESIEGSLPWVPAVGLGDGTDKWLPAETVLFPPPERRIRPAITTGLALGNTPAEAALGGLLEVLERDAAMVAWYSSYDPIRVRVDHPDIERLARFAGLEDLSVSLALLTQDVDVPILAATVYRDDPWPRFAVGSAADFDPIEAASGAIREALQNWTEIARMGREQAVEQSPRLAAYADDPGDARDRLTGPGTIALEQLHPTPPDSTTEALDRLVTLAEDAGLSSYAAWLSTRDLHAVGFDAVRVVLPEAQPLFTGSPFFGTRAKRVPDTLGDVHRPDRHPHPFP